jgi:hypothetical protein
VKLPQSVVLNHKNLKILTPNGYESFYGINKIEKTEYLSLSFTNNEGLKCSVDHPFITIDGVIKAKDLKKTTEVLAKNGGCFLVSKKLIKKKIELYDIVNSGKDNIYYGNTILSHNCLFLGSSDTLISGPKLNTLVFNNPKVSSAGLDVYQDPIEDHTYVMTVDVARGVEKDYSAYLVIDISQFPHKVVAKYRNNQIRPILFPQVIHDVAKSYNNAYILCEVNDVGDQVAAGLHYDLEYSNLLMSSMRGRAGQVLGQGFSGKKVQLGVKMSKTTKKVGCLNLKTLIEDNKITFEDIDVISELTTFVQKGNSFEAEEGRNDDLVMCLVLYAWLILQDYFKELTDQDIRKKIYEEQKNQVEQDMSPFGFISDGITDENNTFIDESGDRWYTDEYGDIASLWSYQ